MAGLRDFLSGDKGKIVGVAVLLIGLGVAVYMFKGSFGTDSTVADANARVFVDKETGKPFNVDLKAGMKIPVKAPSGKESGYPAELCWWTRDGKIRKDPFAVLLNNVKGIDGPTFCPDCGRLVVGHNPRPVGPETKPPPTKEEYEARQKPQKNTKAPENRDER